MATWLFLRARIFRALLAPFSTLLAIFALSTLVGCGRSEFGDLNEPNAETGAETSNDGAFDACLGCDDSSPFETSTDAPSDVPFDGTGLVAITVDPSTTSVPLNSTATFSARGFFSDGTSVDVTSQATWSALDPSVLRFDFNSTFTAIAIGQTRVRATIGTVFGEANVTVPTATVVKLLIDPTSADLPVGGTQQFTATAVFSDGSSTDVTLSAKWGSLNAPVGTIDNGGLFTAIAAGNTTVTVDYSGISAKASVNVSGKTITSVGITPTTPILPVGASQQLTATALFTDGSTADVTTTSAWSSSDPTVVSISPAGLAVALKTGTAIITATFNGVVGSDLVTVQAALTGVGVSPSAATIAPGAIVNLKATANFADGSSSDITSSAIWTTSDATIATVSSNGVVTGIAAGTATIKATFQGLSGSSTITVSPLKLTAIVISPANPSVPRGASIAFKATGTFQDGSSRDITASVTWSEDDGTIASVSNAVANKGTATAIAIGKTNIHADQDGIDGTTLMTVTAATITSITVTPNPLSLVQGTKQFADAVAKLSDGTTLDVTTTCGWSSANAAIATVSNGAGAQGQVNAVGAGSTTISCSQSGVTGSATVNVTGPTLSSLSISPIAPTCNVGDTLQFQATAIDTSGRSTNVTFAAAWSSDAPSIVQATGQPGRFRCIAAGKANVTATYQGKSASTPVTVGAAVVTSIQVDPINATLAVGETQQYQAVAFFSDGTSQNVTAQATFQSSNPAVASISTAGGTRGRATALKAGTTTISATYRGVTGSTLLTVSSATVVSISVSPSNRSIGSGAQVQYSAQAIFSDGTSKDITALATWTSSNTAAAQISDGIGSKGLATTIAAGVTTITAAYQGVTGSTSLTVTSATITSIQVTPFNATTPAGLIVQYRANAILSDGTSEDVTALATWTSSTASVASISDAAGTKGRADTVAAGQTTIKATYQGVSGTTLLTVNSAKIVQIQVTPFKPTIPIGFGENLTATALYDNGTNFDVTALATWTSSTPSNAAVSDAAGSKGRVTTSAAGQATITATYGGVSGTDVVTVSSATLATISITPNPATVSANGSVQLTATGTFSDGTTLDITLNVTWTSSNSTIADVSNAAGSQGDAFGFQAGTVTISAQRGATIGKATLTVE